VFVGLVIFLVWVLGAGVMAQGQAVPEDRVIGAVRVVPTQALDNRILAVTKAPTIFGDRKEYWADDESGQLYVSFLSLRPAATAPAAAASTAPAVTAAAKAPVAVDNEGEPLPAADEAVSAGVSPQAEQAVAGLLVVQIAFVNAGGNAAGKVVDRVQVADPTSYKSHVLINTAKLAAGDYQATAWLEDKAGQKLGEATWTFKKSTRVSQKPAMPAGGLAISLEPIEMKSRVSVPMGMTVPLPRGLVKEVSELRIEKNGKLVPAQFTVNARWSAGGSVRWAYVRFNADYQAGVAEGYRLVHRPGNETAGVAAQGQAAFAVKVTEEKNQIVVDNGTIRFAVRRSGYNGFDRMWYDPSGKGAYNLDAPVVKAANEDAGPYLIDQRLVWLSSTNDKESRVEIEEAGPTSVTILASGWYTAVGRARGRLCQYQVRMTLGAGQSAVRVSYNTIITYDTKTNRLKDVGFGIPIVGASRFAVGIDGKPFAGEVPQGDPAPTRKVEPIPARPAVFMHQQTWDKAVVSNGAKPLFEGNKSDGWILVNPGSGAVGMQVTLKDIWEKFPKELQARHNAVVVHKWPKNGKRVFTSEEELAAKNIYKFWAFHQHPFLDLNLPNDYYEALKGMGQEVFESRPEHAMNGNGQGLTIGNEFEIRFMPIMQDPGAEPLASLASEALDWARLVEQKPVAVLPMEWSALTGAVEPMVAYDRDKPLKHLEEAILNGFLSYARSVERGQEYGMWIWPDTHTYWIIKENRANLHRVWQNSHYHQAGNAWVMWFRTGDRRMLKWARENSDHYRNVSTISYAEKTAAGFWSIPFHQPGGMYHCKGCTPWGSEDTGMIRRDTHAGIYGHWIDPDAHVWAWLMDGEQRARDLFHLWLDTTKQHGTLVSGSRREANNTLAMAVNAYEATLDPDLIPMIWTLGLSLRTKEPLEKQFPGPMWHPLWINRYYHLTRDPEYVPFILKYGRMPHLGDTWCLALSALAYELSGDKTYLTQQFSRIREFPRNYYRAEGDPYDWYGPGPGPLGMRWSEMSLGIFAKALKDAGIDAIPDVNPERTTAPLSGGRKFESVVYGYFAKPGEVEVRANASGVEGDANRGVVNINDMAGKNLVSTPFGQANLIRSVSKFQVPADGMAVIRFDGYGTLGMPVVGPDAQATILRNGVGYRGTSIAGYLVPVGETGETKIRIAAVNSPAIERMVTSAVIKDANGKVFVRAQLAAPFEIKEQTFTVDPKIHPTPWLLDLSGACALVLDGPTPGWVLGLTKEDLKVMVPRLSPLILPAPAK
jgi:hypothetical protein